MKHHKKHGGRHHKARGGAEHGGESHEKHMVASGNPNVIKEAEERKHGGKAKKKRAKGGPVTKNVGLMTGGAVRPRLDRPGRKSGGRVGSDSAPLTSAHRSHGAESTPKTQEGGMSS
jgi:hypothetical protein